MTTPAKNEETITNAYFLGEWFYGGVSYPNGNVNARLYTGMSHRRRPVSVGGGKVAGLWPLKAWYHSWARYVPEYKSWGASPNSDRSSVHQFHSAPYFDAAALQSGAHQVAPFLNLGLFPVNLEAQARTEFLEKLQGSKWELGEALAEVKETAGFLRDGANSLADLLRRMGQRTNLGAKKAAAMLAEGAMDITLNYQAGVVQPGVSRKKQAARADKARRQLADKYGMRPVTQAADMWLGYQFGAKPLLNDLASATVHLNKNLLETPEGQGMRARLSVTKGDDSRRTSSHGINSSQLTGAGTIEWDVRSVVTIVGDYRTDERQLRANQQLGLTSQVGLAYAVIPYSWMLDYFIQFGPWLYGLDAGLGLTPLGASISRTQWVKPIRFTPKSSRMTYTGITPWSAEGSATSDPMAMRMVRSTEPMVFPGFPPLGEMLNVTQALNALAGLKKLTR